RGLDLAAVHCALVAIGPARVAGHHRAGTGDAAEHAVRRRAAGVAAGAAVVDVGVRRRLAAVGGVVVAVGASAGALQRAGAADAGRRGVRAPGTHHVARAAVPGVGGGARLAAVVGHLVAIGVASVARRDRAIAGGASGGAVGNRRACLAAGAAVVG